MILVAAPTAESKDYALDRYLDAYQAFDYKNRRLFLVDTTRHEGYRQKLTACGVPHRYIGWEDSTLQHNIDRAWIHILQYARDLDVDWILSLESDVIAPPETLSYLLRVATTFDAAVVAHSYPQRGHEHFYFTAALGCVLFRRDNFPDRFTMEDMAKLVYMENAVYALPRNMMRPLIQIENVLKIDHLSQ